MHDRAPRSATPTPSTPNQAQASAPVQLRSRGASAVQRSLRGASFAEGEAMLAPVQLRGEGEGEVDIPARAADGVRSGGGALPHASQIQRAFGRHDVSQVKAHQGSEASAAARDIGAKAYASGSHVAFDGAADLHTAAHEAAHIVQQKQGVSLSGGVGQAGDRYERQADAVADKVVKGESAEALLGGPGAGGGAGVVQMEGNGKGGKGRGKKNGKGHKGHKGHKNGKGGGSKKAVGPSGAPVLVSEAPDVSEVVAELDVEVAQTKSDAATESASGGGDQAPKAEAPKDETPEATSTEAPKDDAPSPTEAPKDDAPKASVEAPKPEAPKPNLGRNAWSAEIRRLVNTLPADITDHKKVQSKAKWQDFARGLFKASSDVLEAGGFDPTATAADIATHATKREADLKVAALKETQRIKGGQTPVKAAFWKEMGWDIKGKEWDMKQLGRTPNGNKWHITASGDSILAPSTLQQTDADFLFKGADTIFDALFMAVPAQNRVHVTRENTGAASNHVYLGGVNGAGTAVDDSWFQGDAATMKGELASFRTDAIARITSAQNKGWKLG